MTTGDNQIHAALDVGVACTAIDIIHIIHAPHDQRHIAILLGLVACAIDFLDVAHVTTVVGGCWIS